MPASSDRPETMTKAPSPIGGHPGCGCCSNPSSTLLLRLGFRAQCPFWAPIVLLACNFHHIGASQHIPGLRTVNPSSLHWGRSAQGPRQRQAQRGTGRPHDHRGQEMSTMNRAVGSHDWHNHRSNYRGHRPDSVVATAVGRRSAVVHDAGRNHEPGVSPGVHTATATVKPRAVCTGTPDRPASRSRVRR